MAGMCRICLLGLVILSSLLTGMSGDTRVFSSSGENITLPCYNALSDCTSTTWNYNRDRGSAAVELFAGGIKKNNIERHERLSLGSDCSLNIYKVTKEDYGDYTCQQFASGSHYGNDARVFLHVLQVSASPSSTQTEIKPGSSVTLSCRLFSFEHCDSLVHYEGIQMFWVNQAGVNLQTDSRYQILSSGHCSSTLTTRLLNEHNNTEWRCLVQKSDEIKTSASYTVKYPSKKIKTPVDTTKPVTPDINRNSEDPSTLNTHTHQVIVISAVIAALAVLFPAVLWLVCKKRADNRRGTDNSVVENENKGTYETIKICSLPTPSTTEQNYEVTYCEVTAYNKQQMAKSNVHCDAEVTYAAIKEAEFAQRIG